jgi:hypothetical protein
MEPVYCTSSDLQWLSRSSASVILEMADDVQEAARKETLDPVIQKLGDTRI